jgi:hypothetical protein
MRTSRTTFVVVLAALVAAACALDSQTARGDILVSTYDDSSVERFDESTYAPTSGNIPSGADGLTVAQGLAVGPDQTIYVSSALTAKVQRYDGAGNFLGAFPTAADPAPLLAPSTIQFGPNGNVFVADFAGNAILEFESSGHYVGVAASLDSAPGGFTWAANGDIIVSELFGSIRQIQGGVPTELVPAGIGLTPAGLLRLADGDLLIANLFGNNILRYDSDSGQTGVFANIEHPIPPGGTFPDPSFPSNGPAGIIFNRDGTLLVAISGPDHEHTGEIQRFDLDGNYLGTILSGLGAPTGVALIPEPSSWLLATIGFVAAAIVSWRLAPRRLGNGLRHA